MLKTYRIIPLVFILFFFGFTLITVAPIFAQDWRSNARSINENEERIRMLEDKVRELEDIIIPKDRDPFTYLPNGQPVRQSEDGKFHCVGFPEIRENPDEPKGAAYAKCKQKSGEAKR